MVYGNGLDMGFLICCIDIFVVTIFNDVIKSSAQVGGENVISCKNGDF